MTCALCNRRGINRPVCDRCVQRLHDILDSIDQLHALLPEVLLPGSVPPDGTPHGTQAEPGAPIRLDVLDALDNRRIWSRVSGWYSDERRGTIGLLDDYVRRVVDERNLTSTGIPTVAAEIAFLHRHLAWIIDQPWVTEFNDTLHTILRDLRLLAGEYPPKPIGRCPAEYIDNGHVVTCAAPLYAPLIGDIVQCRFCRTYWTRDQWLLLGRILEQQDAAS